MLDASELGRSEQTQSKSILSSRRPAPGLGRGELACAAQFYATRKEEVELGLAALDCLSGAPRAPSREVTSSPHTAWLRLSAQDPRTPGQATRRPENKAFGDQPSQTGFLRTWGSRGSFTQSGVRSHNQPFAQPPSRSGATHVPSRSTRPRRSPASHSGRTRGLRFCVCERGTKPPQSCGTEPAGQTRNPARGHHPHDSLPTGPPRGWAEWEGGGRH